MKDLGLWPECKGVATPGVSEREEEGTEEAGEVDVRQHRARAARANYLVQDRVDIQFAAREISRFTSKPEPEDWRKARRLGRYLKDNMRVVLE